MKKAIFALIVGLLIGALGAAYFLGAIRSRNLRGISLRPPAQGSNQNSGTVTVAVDEKFFDALLGTVFQQLGPPQLKLSQNLAVPQMQPAAFESACNSALVLNPDGNGVTTSVRFTAGKIVVPLAFTGSYGVASNCFQFKGTAKATVDLSFDQEKQAVTGRLNIEEVNLENVPALVSGLVTSFVSKTIDERINPIEVLHVSQLALSLPIKASGGSLRARVKDVRAEVREGTLQLYVTYDFSGERG